MSRLIDADELNTIKFHPLPYTHIVPNDVNAESYKRGWNDAVDSIIENATTIEPERKTGKWIKNSNGTYSCDKCHSWIPNEQHYYANFCLHCGAVMRGEDDETD